MPKHTFIDLFAGIGGFRLAFESAGSECVFSSEWDKFSQITYGRNYDETPHGDITKIPSNCIPDHDILVAGFPCQPFSISGVSKKNSLDRPHGFADETQGTLFFEIVRILRDKRPTAFMLENVRNLERHDKGRTFTVIMNALHELGYVVHYKVIDAVDVVPQHRERVFIVGFRRWYPFKFPEFERRDDLRVGDILDEEVDEKYTLSDHLWNYLQEYKEKHRRAGNGFGFGLARASDRYTRTLSARYHKDGSEILIYQEGKNPRRLTPRECLRLMGFPETFDLSGVSDTQAYRQCGNSVVVPVAAAIAKNVTAALRQGSKIYRSIHALNNNDTADPVKRQDYEKTVWQPRLMRET